ncbi:MAG: DinB family protein [Dehalococcoidales bacterium]|nr:MAG: DinB family protein [Dehalococcoidales bacterium]
MELNEFILDNLNRIQQTLTAALDSLTYEELTWQPDDEANSIGFLLWHITRCEDTYIHNLILQQPQIWVSERWYDRMNLPDDPWNNGNDYTVEQLAEFRVPEMKDLLEYAEDVRRRTNNFLEDLTPEKSEEVVAQQEFGGISVGELLSYMLCELTQHIGQIAYIRGLQRGLNG